MIAEKQLFKRAILEALSQKYEQELAECREDAKCSKEHYLRISEITGIPLARGMGKRRSLRRTFVAVLIAAALLLAGCTAYVYRNAIKDFFEEVYDTHIKVFYSGEQTDNELYIKEFYSLSYVPEGYQLVREVKNEVCVRYIWESQTANTLVFQQSLINESDFFLDSDTEDMQCMQGIGYKEIAEGLRIGATVEEMKELIKKNSRNFAKRQYTWFNNQMNVHWYDITEDNFLFGYNNFHTVNISNFIFVYFIYFVVLIQFVAHGKYLRNVKKYFCYECILLYYTLNVKSLLLFFVSKFFHIFVFFDKGDKFT